MKDWKDENEVTHRCPACDCEFKGHKGRGFCKQCDEEIEEILKGQVIKSWGVI